MADVQWPADAVERRSVASLIPSARNARVHSDTQIAQIAASVREWGWTVPVLVDEQNGILCGHGRVLAARVLGLDEVPVMIATGWTEAQKRAYIIADNKLALNSSFDEQLLRVEIGDLKSEGFDLGLVGFSELELASFNAPDLSAETEWKGMPEFDQPDAGAFRSVIVHFKDQEAIDQFSNLLDQPVGKKFMWFPQQEKGSTRDESYAHEP